MPDRNQLNVGDKIRILCVPQADLDQREDELKRGLDDAGWTADTIERNIAVCPIVEIEEIEVIEETRLAWYSIEFPTDSAETAEIHRIAIMDDDSWEYVE
ncbi:MAG: hypothetical protein HUJ26_17670 [Planctomycetaceae bacterium]|nr:hypothetical protein [Planctomycetaceae bacterium]